MPLYCGLGRPTWNPASAGFATGCSRCWGQWRISDHDRCFSVALRVIFYNGKEGDNDSASAPPDLIRRFRWSHVVGGGWAAVAEGRDRKALPFPFPFPFLLFPFSFPRLSCASNFAFSARRPFNPPIRCRGISGWRRCGHGLDLEIFQIMRFYSDNSTFFGAFFV